MSIMSHDGSDGTPVGRPSSSPTSLLGRIWKLVRRDGPVAFAVAVFRRYVVDSGTFFLYEYPLLPPPAIRALPPPDGFDSFFVESNEAADRASATRSDFRELFPKARHALDCGAIAFCLYQGRELAHIGWIVTSQKARRALDPLGFEVRFDQGEAWSGAVYTVSRFRNRGLLTYSVVRRFAYLRDAGFETCKAAVERNNAASNSVQMHFAPQIFAVGRTFKFFFWRTWSERPVTENDLPSELRKHHC